MTRLFRIIQLSELRQQTLIGLCPGAGFACCIYIYIYMYTYVFACVFSVAIYNVPDGSMTAMFEGQSGGITHVSFSKDGNYLFAGGRKVRHCLSVPLFKA